MTVLTLPNRPRIASSSFDLGVPKARNQTRGGAHQSVIMGASLWTAQISTTHLERALAGEYDWLRAVAEDSDQTIYVYDAKRPFPLHYSAGGGWGNPMIEEVDYANARIRLSGLVSNAVLAPGDYGHWDDGPARRLHILGGGQASGAGGLWVNVRPRPPLVATAALPVPFVMAKASAEMQLLSSSAPMQGFERTASLTAVQVIRTY
ncbi:MAG: hypothetical protein NW206_19855 [Hyphomonadaceae bacterium]|nr:hypothetical protein [Hyphomonadaceae bacterium]